VKQVITLGMSMWTKRNEKLYGTNLKEQVKVVQHQLICKVEELYDLNTSVHPRYPAIQEIPLVIWRTFVTRTIQAWLCQVAQQRV